MCNTSTPEAASQIYVFLATAPTGVLTATTAGSGKGVAYLWSRCLNILKKGFPPLRELLYFENLVVDSSHSLWMFYGLQVTSSSSGKPEGARAQDVNS